MNWDYELFRALPSILAAGSHEAAIREIGTWLTARLGTPPPCLDCASPAVDVHLEPRIGWVRDAERLGPELSAWLTLVHARREGSREQYYVGQMRSVRNPDFARESQHDVELPDAGYRLLALFRYWNIIEYWFPYRNLIGNDWNLVLTEFIPRLMEAEDRLQYRLALVQLISEVDDTHASISGPDDRPPRGEAQVPVTIKFVEEQPIVTGYIVTTRGVSTGLQEGDVITRIEGEPITSLIARWERYYGASNRPSQLRNIAGLLTRGDAGPVEIEVDRNGELLSVRTERIRETELVRASNPEELPGETFRMLADDVAYLKLSSAKVVEIPGYLEQARNASVLVIDMRSYPSDGVARVLAGHLVQVPTEFARFTHGDLSNPGAFVWTGPESIQPRALRFAGTVVVLVNERTQSAAEFTAMAARAAPNAIVVGSTTAGADGNVSRFALPGGIQAVITGLGVFYPDRSPTQQVGIIPDLEVRPTIAGVRAGRDEVLEAGVSHALGREFRLPR